MAESLTVNSGLLFLPSQIQLWLLSCSIFFGSEDHTYFVILKLDLRPSQSTHGFNHVRTSRGQLSRLGTVAWSFDGNFVTLLYGSRGVLIWDWANDTWGACFYDPVPQLHEMVRISCVLSMIEHWFSLKHAYRATIMLSRTVSLSWVHAYWPSPAYVTRSQVLRSTSSTFRNSI